MRRWFWLFLPVLFTVLILWLYRNYDRTTRLIAERDSLRSELVRKDSAIDLFLVYLRDIDANIEYIKAKELEISGRLSFSTELASDIREKIDVDIAIVNMLMDRNREKLAALQRKLLRSGTASLNLRRLIETLEQKVSLGEDRVKCLKKQLLSRQFTIDELSARIDTLVDREELLARRLKDAYSKRNVVWYVVGTRKELLDNRVIQRVGGFLGIGRMSKLRPDFSQDFFLPLERDKTRKIRVNARQIQLVTNHPADSYRIEHSQGKPIITIHLLNPERFWSVSRYLVVEVIR